MEEPRTYDELEAQLDLLRSAPHDTGTVELIVRRPAIGRRELLDAGELTFADGLVGDSWRARPNRWRPDQPPSPDRQLNVMSARMVALLSSEPAVQALAGDQLYVDLDLSHANLPVGSRISLGDAVIEVTEPPHRGCPKFVRRFGEEAMRFVNSPVGRELRLRGLNARVVTPGVVHVGDEAVKL